MEVSMFTGFTDMDMNDLSFIDHMLQVNSSIDEIFGPSSLTSVPDYGNTFQQETNEADHHTINVENHPAKHLKTITNNQWNPLTSQDQDYDASDFNMLSFSNSSNCSNNQTTSCLVTFPSEIGLVSQSAIDKKRLSKKGATFVSKSQHSKDPVLAERRRREKLNQRFIALTTIIPGLKKTDKASVLGDAVKYVKQLQEQVKKLKENTRIKVIESAVFVKRSKVMDTEEDHHSSMEDDAIAGGSCTNTFPEIEARFSNKDVLIKVHCEKKNGVIEELISQIENLNLIVINSSALVFGCAAIDATIIAQVGDEFSMSAKDLVRHLHVVLKSLM